jgi:hypothetical protein
MTLELNQSQLVQLQELIFDQIDRVEGYDQLSDGLKDILQQISIIKNQLK